MICPCLYEYCLSLLKVDWIYFLLGSGVYKVPHSPPLGGGEVYQTVRGRISSFDEGKVI